MLVDDYSVIEKILSFSKVPVVVHSEDEEIINRNLDFYREKYNDEIPFECHSKIRSEEACLKSTEKIIALARKQMQGFMSFIYQLVSSLNYSLMINL